jgi:1-acyl-sn-glycerol-3-phosphate acyltransferase
VLQPFFHLYFRLSRIGREHIPEDGPVIFAANHRSFLDPFVIGTCMRRPMYYVAKKELFRQRLVGWFLSALGAFPVDRGASDEEMLRTAHAILARGDSLLIFPEGTRTRPGSLGHPKRGVGRLALESGAPVVPIAVIGTENVRRGFRIRPHKVRIRCGRPMRFPRVREPSRELAGAVTDRIWPMVMLQWEWLGGLPPLRRAAVLGDDATAATLAAALARGGLEVERGSEPRLERADLVCFAMPAAELPEAIERHGALVPDRAGVLVRCHGLVPPLGTLPTAFVAERVAARAVACVAGPDDPAHALEQGAPCVLGSLGEPFARQVADALAAAGLDVHRTGDVPGVETAGSAERWLESAARAA